MISILVPVFNEENTIELLLKHLDTVSGPVVEELLLIDGGSHDHTIEKIKNYSNKRIITNDSTSFPIKILTSKKGRASQMNFGAQHAKAEILYFLHADSFPPTHFDTAIASFISNGKKAGCFRMKFDDSHWWLRLMSWFTKINHRACRGGDQSLFVCKKLFNNIGGFDENYIIFEDNDFIGKLYDQKMFAVIPEWIITSARRYHKHGIWRLQYYYLAMYLKRWLGASGSELYDYYKEKISK
ncbi:TIGR04283 family arsenosugar biosynthesis glycosyltransferase [Aquimarina sp. W85]|uniref:TIGR04283 family arsenosugar biosynthesis glycosyltransferase n=1 Tax=Aquimarina rhodophyticola TaxID=3342246 RepID=UPI00366BA3F5